MDTGGTRDIVHPGMTGLLSADADGVLARSGASCSRDDAAARRARRAARVGRARDVLGGVGRRTRRTGLSQPAAAAGGLTAGAASASRGRGAGGHAASRLRRARAVGARSRAASGGTRRRRHAHRAAADACSATAAGDPFASPRIHAPTRAATSRFRSPTGAARRSSIAARRTCCTASAPAGWPRALVARRTDATSFTASARARSAMRARTARRRRSC